MTSPFHLTTKGVFKDTVAACLRFGLSELGFDVGVSDYDLWPGVPTVIFTPFDAAGWDKIPSDVIILNLEPLDTPAPWIKPLYLEQLGRHRVWDYSLANIEWMRGNGINPDARWLRLGWSPGVPRIPVVAQQDIDVLFFGSLSPRRVALLETMRATGLTVAIVNRVYGEALHAQIARAKVIVHINFFETRTFEMVRLSYLLPGGKAVVVECAEGCGEPDLCDALVAVPYEELSDACRRLVADHDRRKALEDSARRIFTARSQADFLRPVLEASGIALPS
jgi:hypothetical protein